MAKRSGLGKGLDALITSTDTSTDIAPKTQDAGIQQVAVDKIGACFVPEGRVAVLEQVGELRRAHDRSERPVAARFVLDLAVRHRGIPDIPVRPGLVVVHGE